MFVSTKDLYLLELRKVIKVEVIDSNETSRISYYSQDSKYACGRKSKYYNKYTDVFTKTTYISNEYTDKVGTWVVVESRPMLTDRKHVNKKAIKSALDEFNGIVKEKSKTKQKIKK